MKSEKWIMVRVTRETHRRMEEEVRRLRGRAKTLVDRLAFKPKMSFNDLVNLLLDDKENHRARAKKQREKRKQLVVKVIGGITIRTHPEQMAEIEEAYYEAQNP